MRIFEIYQRVWTFGFRIYFSAGISSFWQPFLLDRFDREEDFTLGLLGLQIVTLAVALSPEYPDILAAILSGNIWRLDILALILAIIGDVVPDSEEGRAMGLVHGWCISVASVLEFPMGYS